MADGQRRRPAHGAPQASARGARGPRAAGARQRLASDSDRISTIRAGQGARVTTRSNAAEAAGRARHNAEERYYERHPEARSAHGGPRRSRKNVVLLVLAALAAMILVFFLGRCAAAVLSPSSEEAAPQQGHGQTALTDAEREYQEQQTEHDAGSEQTGVDGTVSYEGVTYALRQLDDGGMGLVRVGSDGADEVLAELEGTPIALVRRAETLLVPENRDGAWDVVCYVIGGHGSATYVAGQDGSMVQGAGEATSVELSGATLRMTDASGSVTEVALE